MAAQQFSGFTMSGSAGYRTVSVGRANRRRDMRATSSHLKVKVRDRTVEANDWSLGGFALPDYIDGIWRGDDVDVEIGLPNDAGDEWFLLSVEVVRNDPIARRFTARFNGLTDAAFDALQASLFRSHSAHRRSRQIDR